MHHRGAGARRADDRVGFALFENFDKTSRYRSRFVEITGVESRLRATRLAFVKLNLTTNAPQHLDTAHADASPHLIDQTRYEKRNPHEIANCQLPIADLRTFGTASIGNWQSAIGNEVKHYVDAEES
jgi:hypothetical protein